MEFRILKLYQQKKNYKKRKKDPLSHSMANNVCFKSNCISNFFSNKTNSFSNLVFLDYPPNNTKRKLSAIHKPDRLHHHDCLQHQHDHRRQPTHELFRVMPT